MAAARQSEAAQVLNSSTAVSGSADIALSSADAIAALGSAASNRFAAITRSDVRKITMRFQQCMRVTTAFLSGMFAVGAANAAESDIAALGWMAGCWAPEKGEVGSVEQWLQPAGGIMLGVGGVLGALGWV